MIIQDKNPSAFFQQLIEDCPLSPDELKSLGNQEFQQNNFQASINLFLNALNKTKSEPIINQKLVMLLHSNLSLAYN